MLPPSGSLLAVIALASQALGAILPIKSSNGEVKKDSYIIMLKDSVDKTAHLQALGKIMTRDSSSSSRVTHKYDSVLHGYAATLTGSALNHILASSDVKFVEADGIVKIINEPEIIDIDIDGEGTFHTEVEAQETENGIEVETAVEKRAAGGAGVDIYGIDTGINTAHVCFGGRASWGTTFGGYANKDGNGHGTHTAGTAVCNSYGVATSARIIAVKVLSDQGSGYNSDVISGVNWAYNQFRSKRRTSIVTMSLGGSKSSALDQAVSNAIAGGLHFSIAAGNSAVDASMTSPADVVPANTIGAIDGSTNRIASFSNFGSLIDVFAPGVNILSAWIGSNTATARLSGTSMATPYVAGVMAVALGEYGQVSPASLSNSLKSHAKAVVTGQPAGTTKLRAALW